MIQNIKNFDLEQIAQSGQCFRWRKIDEGKYIIPAYDHVVTVAQSGDKFEFSCTEEEYQKIWKHYFDLELDYGRIIEAIDTKDRFLKEAAAYGSGIRILNQELWEMIISYIISQNNNIPRIKKGIEAVCNRYKAVVCKESVCQSGKENADKSTKSDIAKNIKEDTKQSTKKVCADKKPDDTKQDDKDKVIGSKMAIYGFPHLSDIEINGGRESLSELGLGYRDEYIWLMCNYENDNKDFFEKLRSCNYEQSMKMLMEHKGIGKKVANCISLFGLHHLDACPIDTWMKKIIDEEYGGKKPEWMSDRYAGIYQQYAFFYKRSK